MITQTVTLIDRKQNGENIFGSGASSTFAQSGCKLLEPISKIRLVFRARRETVKKRSIHVVCEHFEPFRNIAMGT